MEVYLCTKREQGLVEVNSVHNVVLHIVAIAFCLLHSVVLYFAMLHYVALPNLS